MKQTTPPRLALTLAILCALPLSGYAVETQPDPQPTGDGPATASKAHAGTATGDAQSLESVVVTGTATAGGVKKLDASYTITAASSEQIKQANPKTTADLLKISPGIWPEATGGQTGANVNVAGFPSGSGAPFFTVMLMGSPLYGAPTLSFFETTSAFRVDDTIERAEIVQGGPTVIYGPGQIGGTANFILRQGTSEPSGSIGLTYGDEGLWRVDGFYGFKIADGWYGSVGGFWRESDGVRNPQFKADKGSQLTATLTHDLDNGSLMLYARRLDDHNQFLTPIPVRQTGVDSYTDYPGFDPLTATYYSRAVARVVLPGYDNGRGIRANLADGRRPSLNFFGGNFDYELPGGWSLSDKFNYTLGYADTRALFSGTNPKPLSYYAYGCNVPNTTFCSSAGKPLDSDTLSLPAAATVNANYVGGGAVGMQQSVIHQGWWYIHKRLKSLSNELRVSRDLFDGNTLTAGGYLAHYSSDDKWSQGAQMLMSNTPNATPITLNYVNNGTTYQKTDAQGFLDYGSSNLTENGVATNKAFFLADTWRIDRWLIDAGARVENERARMLVCNQTRRALDTDPLTLYNNSVPICNGTFARTDYDKTHPAFTLGVNYEIADNQSAYGRATKGPHFGDFDNAMRGFTTGNTAPVQKFQGFEIGYKYQNEFVFADVSFYHRQFSGLSYQPTDGTGAAAVDTNGKQLPPSIYGSDSKGINLSATLTPVENLKIGFVGNIMDGHYSHYNACIKSTDINGVTACNRINGVQIQRQPKNRFAITPSYRLPFEWGDVTAFVTYTHVGDHTQDISGLQHLGTFHTLDFGVVANVGNRWELRAQGTNLTNSFGLTESNSRFFGSSLGLDGTVLARPLEGREINVQAKYKF